MLRALYSFAAEDLDAPGDDAATEAVRAPEPGRRSREHRVLTDAELARVLDACDERSRLFFRTVAETGCRDSEALGLSRHVGNGTVSIESASSWPEAAPSRRSRRRRSKRTIEIPRGLSAELRLAGDTERVFSRLYHREIGRQWAAALARAELDGPRPVIHDLRHTHASRLIALGWDPVEIAGRLGDRIETVLRVYAHEFDARRRSAERRAALESLYGEDGNQMATNTPLQTATDGAKVQRLPTHRNTG